MKKEGKITEDVWERVISGEEIPFYVPEGLTLDYLKSMRKKSYRSFYLNPKYIFKQLKNRKKSSMKNKFIGLMNVLEAAF